MAHTGLTLWRCKDQLRLVLTGLYRSLNFQDVERPRTRPRSRSFAVLGICGPNPVLVRSSPGLLTVLGPDLQTLVALFIV
jgi:hypothetical protein